MLLSDPIRGRLLSEIDRCIPRYWKGSLNRIEKAGNHLSDSNLISSSQRSEISICRGRDKLRLCTLLNSLKDFAIGGELSKAFAVFSLIRYHVISCSHSSSCVAVVLSISSLLEASADGSQFLSQGRQLHGQSIYLGVDTHPYLLPRLISFYSAFNLLSDAHSVAESSSSMKPLRWNMVISTYVRNGLSQEALSVYRKMLDSGIRPDDFTFASVLKACGEQMNLSFGREIHRNVAVGSRRCNVYVQNALISMYGKCGQVQVARELFDELLERDTVSWNTIVSVCASKGMWEEAFQLFERMLSEVSEVSGIMWNTIAGGYLQNGKFLMALYLLSKMKSSGVRLDDVGAVIGLTACSHVQDVKLGQQFHACSIRGGNHDYHNVSNALITMYSRCKELTHAYAVFRQMEDTSVVTWNAIISGYSYWDRLDKASSLFREMLLSGFEPNHVTISSILPLCGRLANLRHGRQFHCYIIKRGEGFSDHLALWNSVIDMYARSGKIVHAKRVFDSLRQKNEVTYTSLIAGYGVQGQGEVALEVFNEMRHVGIQPDHITLLAVLSACSHSGLVKQGQLMFDNMESEFGISPCVEHYACMVDLFGRAGLLMKALEVIRRMPFKPTPEIWVTLVGACRVHENMELGKWAAEKLLEMRPANSGYYVLIANMYADAGCWSKLAGVRTLIRDLGLRNTPASAAVPDPSSAA